MQPFYFWGQFYLSQDTLTTPFFYLQALTVGINWMSNA